MNPYLSWAIVLFVATGLGWYYTSRPSLKGRTAPVKIVAEKNEHPFTSKRANRKPRKSPDAPPTNAAPAVPVKAESEIHGMQGTDFAASERPDGGIDNQEFARRISKMREGTSTSGTLNGSKKKAQLAPKNGTHQLESGGSELSGSRVSTRSSSITGADADDDLSPAGSPQANVTVPARGDIVDMLEAPSPGVSVLRLTGVVENEQKKKQKSEPFKTVETKKQRQRRIKNENKKLLVEDAEKQRRVLLEKQLHTARESERQEAARSKPVTSNAWNIDNSSRASNGDQKVRGDHSTPLLDTFDSGLQRLSATSHAASSSIPAPVENTTPLSSSTHGSWADDLPPEEEQMRLLGAMGSESEWRTVSNMKKEKRKGARREGSVSDASNSDSHTKDTAERTPHSASIAETLQPPSQEGHLLDATWAP